MDRLKYGDKVLVVDAQKGIIKMQQMVGKVCTISNNGPVVYELAECPVYGWKREWLELYDELYVENHLSDLMTDEIEAILKGD